MKTLFILIFLTFGVTTMSQSTYSRLYNLDVGFGNRPRDFVQFSDEFVILSGHLCYADTNNCSSVAHFDYEGNILNINTIEQFYLGNENCILIEEGSTVISGHNDDNGFTTIYLLKSNFPVSEYDIFEHLQDDGFLYTNNGLLNYSSTYYTYGDSYDSNEKMAYASIIKWDSTASKILGKWNYHHGTSENHCDDLQPTPDGHLAFINKAEFQDGVRNHIVKIDTSGDEINKYIFEDLSSGVHPNLLVSEAGDFYFSSRRHPNDVLESSRGRINKLDEGLKELEWSLILPYDPFTNNRDYIIKDFIQSKYGDIVVRGQVWDKDELDAEKVGFMARRTQESEIEWLRLYKVPNNIEPDVLGHYRRADLIQLQENEVGGFIAVGYCDQPFPDRPGLQELWILSVDENGCINPEVCEEVNILTSTVDAPPLELDVLVFPNPASDIIYLAKVGSFEYLISDINGSIVMSGQDDRSIELNDLRSGTYFLRILSASGKLTVHKMVKL